MEKPDKHHGNRLDLRRIKSSLLDRMGSPVVVSAGIAGAVVLCAGGVIGGFSYLGNKSGEALERESIAVCDYASADTWYAIPEGMDEDRMLEQLRGLGHGGNKPLELGRVSCDAALSAEDVDKGSLVAVKGETWGFDTRRACMTVRLPEQYEQPSAPSEVYVVCSTPLPGSP